MVHIPHELQVEIFRRLGSFGFTFLGPAIAASKQTMEAVYSPEVLKVADLSEFVIDPAMAKTDSIYRHFFIACVLNGYVMGNHVEALRILCQEGPTNTAFAMLALTLPHSIYSTFVSVVFRICVGDYEGGMGTLSHIWDLVDSCEEAVSIGDMVVQQIVRLETTGTCIYSDS